MSSAAATETVAPIRRMTRLRERLRPTPAAPSSPTTVAMAGRKRNPIPAVEERDCAMSHHPAAYAVRKSAMSPSADRRPAVRATIVRQMTKTASGTTIKAGMPNTGEVVVCEQPSYEKYTALGTE